ncbi:hypothetical protein IGI37_003212 [Enterococcus sp. AZ194]|uniref:DUF7006 family protein n=1 Tax=Enterococcus sp. AZ194 TaxID=2774629 RepID=UPI003F24C48B
MIRSSELDRVCLAIDDVDGYFSTYDETLSRRYELAQKAKLLNYYCYLKETFQEQIEATDQQDFLKATYAFLLLDAKLQILFFFWLNKNLYGCTEEAVIEMVESDCYSYYQDTWKEQPASGLPPSLLAQVRLLK